MIIPDLNLLVYAYDSSMQRHERAKSWWEACLNGNEPVGLAWSTILGFLRVTTSRHSSVEPFSLDESDRIVQRWLGRRIVTVVEPGSGHYDLMIEKLREAGSAGKLVSDAHLAAIAIEHRAVLHTHDKDFARFSGLEIFDPLLP